MRVYTVFDENIIQLLDNTYLEFNDLTQIRTKL